MESKEKLSIIVDENITVLDKFLQRITFCFAEVPISNHSESVMQEISDFGDRWCAKNPDSKFHITDFSDPSDIDTIIGLIVKLRPTIKLFTSYTTPRSIESAKRALLKEIIEGTFINNYRNVALRWVIENSSDYDKIIAPRFLNSDKRLTIVPDVFCGLFARRLNGVNAFGNQNSRSPIATQYKRLRPLIRLEYAVLCREKLTLEGNNVI